MDFVEKVADDQGLAEVVAQVEVKLALIPGGRTPEVPREGAALGGVDALFVDFEPCADFAEDVDRFSGNRAAAVGADVEERVAAAGRDLDSNPRGNGGSLP